MQIQSLTLEDAKTIVNAFNIKRSASLKKFREIARESKKKQELVKFLRAEEYYDICDSLSNNEKYQCSALYEAGYDNILIEGFPFVLDTGMGDDWRLVAKKIMELGFDGFK